MTTGSCAFAHRGDGSADPGHAVGTEANCVPEVASRAGESWVINEGQRYASHPVPN